MIIFPLMFDPHKRMLISLHFSPCLTQTQEAGGIAKQSSVDAFFIWVVL